VTVATRIWFPPQFQFFFKKNIYKLLVPPGPFLLSECIRIAEHAFFLSFDYWNTPVKNALFYAFLLAALAIINETKQRHCACNHISRAINHIVLAIITPAGLIPLSVPSSKAGLILSWTDTHCLGS
jgi:hypothetical protein